jgi:hypothetical protein
MKILIITYTFFPDQNPRAFRWGAVVKNLIKYGHAIDIICATKIQKEDSFSGPVIYSIKDCLSDFSQKKNDINTELNEEKYLLPILKKLKFIIVYLFRVIYKIFRWPDFACGWLIPAIIAGRSLCKTKDYDWIISVSHPFTSHVVALFIKPCLPQAKWLVDIGDPFYLLQEPPINNQMLYGYFNKIIEGRILSFANMISVTTKGTLLEYEKFFTQTRNKIQVIPPLLSIGPNIYRKKIHKKNIITLVFAGTLYKHLRSPEILLLCFQKLIESYTKNKLELHFYGEVNDCKSFFDQCSDHVRPHLFVHGVVSRKKVAAALAKADILVNIGNNSSLQLPSKIFEYIFYEKPILNFVSIRNDSSLKIIKDYPVLTIYKRNKILHQKLIEKIEKFVTHPPIILAKYKKLITATYSSERVSSLYNNIFLQDINNKNKKQRLSKNFLF